MRFSNQLTVGKFMSDKLSKMSQAKENSDNSSEISDSLESGQETNNNNSMMSDNFNTWSISKPELGLAKITKSFAVLCEGESETNETSEFKQAPSSRWVV